MSPVKELGWWIWFPFTTLAVLALIYPKEKLGAYDAEMFWFVFLTTVGNALRLRRRIRETCATKLEIEMALILHPGALVFAIALAGLAWKQGNLCCLNIG
ncbi:MAG: hypothetical protein RL088_2841 [Verrucomicrobiota bacterium]|jgi:hypothetical protein